MSFSLRKKVIHFEIRHHLKKYILEVLLSCKFMIKEKLVLLSIHDSFPFQTSKNGSISRQAEG